MQNFPKGASLVAQIVKNLQCVRPGFDPWVGTSPWRREWLPTPALFPGEFHGQRSLASCSPWGRKESEMTEATQHACTQEEEDQGALSLQCEDTA